MRSWPAFGLLLLLGCDAEDSSADASGTQGATEGTEGDAASSVESNGTGATSADDTSGGGPGGEDSTSGGSGLADDSGDDTGAETAGETGDPPPTNLTPGCGMAPTGDVLDGLIEVEGVTRDYIIEIPADYDPNTAYPLVFGFHGSGGYNDGAQNGYRLFEHYDGQAIVVYPNGSGAGGSNAWDLANGSGDFDFIVAVASEIGYEMCVDLEHVHAFGYSFGGGMAHAVGCYRGDLFTAIGAASGWAPSTGLCQRPIPVAMSHGVNDDVVPYSSGVSARDAWAEYSGCSSDTVELAEEGCVEYVGCDTEAPVQWCEFNGAHMFNGIYAEMAVDFFRSL